MRTQLRTILKFQPTLFLLSGLIALSSLTGCVSTPGSMGRSTSMFDGTKEVSIEPGWLSGGHFLTAAPIKLGVHWSSAMGQNAVIDAYFSGTDSITGIKFNIDGEVFELQALDATTKFDYTPGVVYGTWSSMRFAANLAFIEKLVSANKVIVKISLSKSYVEGVFSTDASTMARPGFRKFLKQVHQTEAQ
jgi:hypothetical protein